MLSLTFEEAMRRIEERTETLMNMMLVNFEPHMPPPSPSVSLECPHASTRPMREYNNIA